jgi:hypothetical protein
VLAASAPAVVDGDLRVARPYPALPHGVANGVVGAGEVVGEVLATTRGSTRSASPAAAAGRRLMELGARTFKRVSIEAGGKAPVIVFPDANLEKAMDAVAVGIFLYAGQSCTAGSRLLIERSLHDRFLDGLVERATALKVGSPLDDATQLGPMVRASTGSPASSSAAGRGRPAGDRWRALDGEWSSGFLMAPTISTTSRHRCRSRARRSSAGPVGDRVHGGRGAGARHHNESRSRQRSLTSDFDRHPRRPAAARRRRGLTPLIGSPKARPAASSRAASAAARDGRPRRYLESKRVHRRSSTFHLR